MRIHIKTPSVKIFEKTELLAEYRIYLEIGALELIDIYQYPIFAKDGQIVAAPTLIKELPPPLRKLRGSMADTERILLGMDLKSKADK